MSSANFSTNLDLPFLIKILLPGFVTAFLGTYLLFPLATLVIGYSPIFDFAGTILNLSLIDKLILWVISGFILGIVITSLDSYIYDIFQGFMFWPCWIREWCYIGHRDIYNKLTTDIPHLQRIRDNSNNEIEIENLTNEIRKMSKDIREYPIDEEFIESTKLGNIIAEYETYSDKQYGIKFNIFMSRLWYILPEEVRKDIQLRGARADSLVYLSFIFFIFAPLAMIRIIQTREIFFKWIGASELYLLVVFMLLITIFVCV